MTKSEKTVTFDNVPELLSGILDELREMRILIISIKDSHSGKEWMSLQELRDFLPEHPAKATVYEWVAKKTIPFHKNGKALRFNLAEIEKWIKMER